MSGVFLEAFVDPGGCPGPLFFSCTVCQPRARAGAEVEAEATVGGYRNILLPTILSYCYLPVPIGTYRFLRIITDAYRRQFS